MDGAFLKKSRQQTRIRKMDQENASGNRSSISATRCRREHLPALSLQRRTDQDVAHCALSFGRQDRVGEVARSIGVQNNIHAFHKFPRRSWE